MSRDFKSGFSGHLYEDFISDNILVIVYFNAKQLLL